MTLKLNGYSTAQFGKCHEVPVWQSSPMGPFDAWPSGGGGFETFYGFIGGENNQWDPALYDGTTPVEPPATPEEGYHLTEDLTDRAVRLDAPAEGADAGQAVLRLLRAGRDPRARTTCPRSGPTSTPASSTTAGTCSASGPSPARRSSGVIPADAELTARHDEIPAWDDMPDELKPVLARQMEVYAGFLEHTDHHVGRLIDAHRGPRGPRRHDHLLHHRRQRRVGRGHRQRRVQRDGQLQRDGRARDARVHGRPRWTSSARPSSYNHYSVGWAWAMNAPFQWTKQVASHWGGTRNGTIVHWPNGIEDRGGLRSQFTHVIDLAPTILEAAGLPEPTMVNGVQQSPMEGTSMLYSFSGADAAERHDLQYFEMFGNRGIYHQGWSAVTKHRTPWDMVGGDAPGVRRRRVGAVRRQHRLQPGA